MNALYGNLSVEERFEILFELLNDYRMLQLFYDAMEFAGGSLYSTSEFENWQDFLEKWNILFRVIDAHTNPESYE